MKIACVGAGGWFFAKRLGDVAVTEGLHGATIALYDIDRQKADMTARLARRFSDEAGAGLKVECASSLAEAVEGASFVLACVGGAGATGPGGYFESPTHIGDCAISARHGVYHIVGCTTGPVAMMAAFRCIPIYLDICREMERHAPEAIIINHANPMAVLCRAMNKHAGVRGVIGICHGVQIGIRHAAEVLEVEPQELDAIWIGTNHYYWFTRLCVGGRDVMAEFWRRVRERDPEPGSRMCHELSEVYGHWIVYPEDDHAIAFYPFLTQVRDPDELPYGLGEYGFGKAMAPYYRGEKTVEELRQQVASVPHEEALKAYAETREQAKLPDKAEGGVMGEGLADLISNIAHGRRAVHIVNIPNKGSIPNLPADAIVEVEGVTDSCGVRGVVMGEAPLVLEALLRKRFAWHELVADAAVKGDRRLALQAMMMDERATPPDRASALLDELLQNSKGMLPQFGLGA